MLVVPLDITDAASAAAAAARIREELQSSTWPCCPPVNGMDGRTGTEVFDQHVRVNLTGMSNSIAAVLLVMLRRLARCVIAIRPVAGVPRAGRRQADGATKAQIYLLRSAASPGR